MLSRLTAFVFLCAVVTAAASDGFKDCPACPELVAVPAGEFMMGSERAGEAPRHEVSIRAPFALGRREVTVAEWDACVAAGGCERVPPQERTHSVTDVTWREAMAYAAWLSEQTGFRYRLPSEAEWEHAARANVLDGMLGGVAEWTEDCWHESYAGAPSDGNARTRSLRNSLPEPYATWPVADCSLRVLRGGSSASATARAGAGIDSRSPSTGFRVARPLP